MITLILVRHGETNWNREGRLQGLSDSPLTSSGKKQAIYLSERLANLSIDIIYCSKLKRAKQTAKIIAKRLGKKIIYESAFNERSWGIFEGKVWGEEKEKLQGKYEFRNPHVKPKNGESYFEFEKRILEGIEKILERDEEKTVLLITHGGVIRNLTPSLKNMPREKSHDFRIQNSSLTILKMDKGQIIEELINDIEHLN